MTFRKGGTILCTAFILLISSCVSYSINEDFIEIEQTAASGKHSLALDILEQRSDDLYKDTDKVLYELDSGMLAHYSKNYESSNAKLSEAEQLIYDYYAKSISQAVGSAIVNDTLVDYAGEDYEDIYTNVFMALNYIQLENIEGAFVEIRRFDNKLKALSVKYRDQLLEAQKAAEQNYPQEDYNIEFTNSALARYISMLLYRSEGNLSSAEVDLRLIQQAFSLQPNLYPFDAPSNLEDDIFIPQGKARLNILSYTGKGPIKIAETLRVPLYDSYLKIELPVLIERSSEIESIYVTVKDSSNSTIHTEAIQLQKIESIEKIVSDTFAQRQALIYLKTIARAIAKSSTTEVLGHASRNANNGNAALIFSLLSFGSQIFTEVSEQADLRIAHFFPGSVHVGGITLNPGTYTVSIEYKNAKNKVVQTDIFPVVELQEGNNLHLIESAYLR